MRNTVEVSLWPIAVVLRPEGAGSPTVSPSYIVAHERNDFHFSRARCGIAIGFGCPPGEWYARLKKPSFKPPNWAFAPAWTILYVLIAIAGWRTWEDGTNLAFMVWVAQLGVNYGWSPAFFRTHRGALALTLILILLALIFVLIGLEWNADRPAALLFIPYGAWVAFASTLNAALLRLNWIELRG